MSQTGEAVYVSDGAMFDYDNSLGSAIDAGDVVVAGNIVAVAHDPIAAAQSDAKLLPFGVVDVVKLNGAVRKGYGLYWDEDGDPYGGTSGTGCARTASTGNKFLGWAIEDADGNAEKVRVLLAGPRLITSVQGTGYTAALTWSGTLTAAGTCQSKAIRTDSATATLGAATAPGWVVTVNYAVGTGNVVLTVTNGLNDTGNNTATLAAAGDFITLVSMKVATNYRWRKISMSSGCTLSTA
jgi:predicted RecA/RadA family phage recombinase